MSENQEVVKWSVRTESGFDVEMRLEIPGACPACKLPLHEAKEMGGLLDCSVPIPSLVHVGVKVYQCPRCSAQYGNAALAGNIKRLQEADRKADLLISKDAGKIITPAFGGGCRK